MPHITCQESQNAVLNAPQLAMAVDTSGYRQSVSCRFHIDFLSVYSPSPLIIAKSDTPVVLLHLEKSFYATFVRIFPGKEKTSLQLFVFAMLFIIYIYYDLVIGSCIWSVPVLSVLIISTTLQVRKMVSIEGLNSVIASS